MPHPTMSDHVPGQMTIDECIALAEQDDEQHQPTEGGT